jgi:ureidoglycolate lyase
VIDFDTDSHYSINGGRCERYHALAKPEATGPNGHVLINLFRGTPYDFPLKLTMVERHPFGSQAFIPLSPRPFVVVACPNGPDGPGEPAAFLTAPGQGVNYPRGLWHGVLTPIGEAQDFVVVDRGGDGSNVEEFHFSHPYEIHLPQDFRP